MVRLDLSEQFSMTAGRIHLHTADTIATVVIDNPSKRNALDSAMRAELLKVLLQVDADNSVRIIRITGEGDAFCAGGDLNYLKVLKENEDDESFNRLLDDGRQITDLLRKSAKPTIAAVNGPALAAGFFIALACDIRVCSASATFGVPLVKIGLGPDWGCTYWLPRIVGTGKAMEMLLTGESVKGEEAVRIGLASRVWPDAELQSRSLAMCRQLAAYPTHLLSRLKQAVHASENGTEPEIADLERRLQLDNFRSPDLSEGIAAFFERRPPNFP